MVPCPSVTIELRPFSVFGAEEKKNVKGRFQVALCHRKGEVACLAQHRPHCHSGLRVD